MQAMRGEPTASHAAASSAAAPRADLDAEQLAAATAPLDEALVVVAAAGTGKTTTMLHRVRHMLSQGVPPEAILALTFSNRAKSEFQQRLRDVPGAQEVTVSTFHAWAWTVLRRHWRPLGFAQRPNICADEEQLLAVMRDCLVWDRLGELRPGMCARLFLPPSATWADLAAAAQARHQQLYAAALRAALEGQGASDQQQQQPSVAAASGRPFSELPARVQMLLLVELHGELERRFPGGSASRAGRREEEEEEEAGCGAAHWLGSAERRAPEMLSWLEQQKRNGRMPDADAHAAYLAARPSSAGRGGQADPQHARRLRVAAAFQQEMQRQCLVSLTDLPLLARRILSAGGEQAAGEGGTQAAGAAEAAAGAAGSAAPGPALLWARERWSHVLVDEFQDTGRCMLDLLKLLMGGRRSVTVVGDDDQSIYSFLSAVPGIFREFRAHFQARLACLQTNFRSTPAICAFGTSLLHGNRGRAAEKCMLAARCSTPSCPVLVRQFGSAQQEAEALATEVHRLWREEGVPLSSVAALFRCLRLKGSEPHGPLKAALRRRGIPFVVVGNERLAEDEGVAALISYLATLANPSCDPAFQRVLGLPHHGFGTELRAALAEQRSAARLAGCQPPSLLQCAERLTQAVGSAGREERPGGAAGRAIGDLVDQLNGDDMRELGRLVQLLRDMQTAVGREPLPQAVRRVLCESGLMEWLQQQRDGLEEAGGGGQQQQGQGPLPPRLQVVLQKAQELAAEWQQQQQQGQGQGVEDPAAPAGGGEDGGGDGQPLGSQEQRQAGVELVKELLMRLATDTAADLAAPAPVDSSDSAEARRQRDSWLGPLSPAGQPDPDPGALTISTIHAAKGLEWPVVLLPSACDGHLPLAFRPGAAAAAWRAREGGLHTCGVGGSELDLAECSRQHFEEERRLFHVAATRAKDRLLVSYLQPSLRELAPHLQGAAGDDDMQAPAQGRSQQQQQQPSSLEGLGPADLPLCSSILACTVGRLRMQQRAQRQGPGGGQEGQAGLPQEVVQLEGRLPQDDFPEMWQGLAEEPLAAAPPPPAGQRAQQAGALAASNGHGQQAGPSQMSIAERCRQRLAAGRGTGGGVAAGRVGKPLRGPRRALPKQAAAAACKPD